MLLLDFFNVGDGDAALLREKRVGKPDFVVLVDCGRPYIEHVVGSKRAPALTGLMRENVDHIDCMLLTHLHIDHIGGTCEILRSIPVQKIITLYLPPEDAAWVSPLPGSTKTVVGLSDALNQLSDIVSEAKLRGTQLTCAAEGETMLTGRLGMQLCLPDAGVAERQKELFDRLYHGGRCEEDVAYRISKERNASSLMARFTYAGRSVLITGDCYGTCWECAGQAPCDILKLPHHGDGKSITEPLLKSLSPKYAVISCQNTETQEKDRPSQPTVDMLLRHVPHIYCTENKPMTGMPAGTHDAIRFSIAEDGTITCLPDSDPI